jgi:sugar (pentulose or hexulose) kinase
MNRSYVIGIDASTTACKAIAWDRRGRLLAEGRATYPLLQPAPKQYEQDAEGWWRGTCAAVRTLLDQVEPAGAEGLCITHQRESFVLVDREGRPLRNAILWLDERSQAQVGRLKAAIGAGRFHRITGKPLTPNPSITKLLWLAEYEPDLLARAHQVLDAGAFLAQRLTGHFRTSLASADPMGLLDMRTGTWSPELLKPLGINAEQLPDLVPPGSVIGAVSAGAAAQTGLSTGLPLIAGAGDGQCAGLGANATGEGRAALNLGTAVVSGATSDEYLTERAFRTLYAALPGAYFLETVIQGGVFTIGWFVERFCADLRGSTTGTGPEEILEREAAHVPPGCLGLTLVPYWNHAMTPYWDPAARGIVVGWTGAHGRAHFYRAILEGIGFEQRLVGDALMEATGRRLDTYVALGGGSRSPLWCQILADVTGVPLVRAASSEATCLGAGMLAAAAAGWYADAEQAAAAMATDGERFDPQPDNEALYQRLFEEVYRPLYPTLQPLIHRLDAVHRMHEV